MIAATDEPGLMRFSDFVEKPVEFEEYRNLLHNKTCSNLSLIVEEKVVYVIHGILTSRSEFFRAMFESFFKESQLPMMIKSQIPTMDIKSLSDPKTTGNIIDRERVYVAANMYNLCDLCDALVRYLEHLVDEDNFGEVYQIAKRIGVVSLETSIFRFWMSNSVSFNEKNDQINLLLHDLEDVKVEKTQAIEPNRGARECRGC
jgi:Iap family predicted aminopeptidase